MCLYGVYPDPADFRIHHRKLMIPEGFSQEAKKFIFTSQEVRKYVVMRQMQLLQLKESLNKVVLRNP